MALNETKNKMMFHFDLWENTKLWHYVGWYVIDDTIGYEAIVWEKNTAKI